MDEGNSGTPPGGNGNTTGTVPVRTTALLDRADVLHAIALEPEYPGEVPPELGELLNLIVENNDMDAIIHALRLSVRMTKEGITERVMALVAA